MELEIEALERTLLNKGYTQPQVWLGIKWIGNYCFNITAYNPNAVVSDKTINRLARGDTYEDALQRAKDEIDALPNTNEEAENQFRKDLAKMIDRGNELGLTVNPLVDMMKALSSNIIEDMSK
jgi:hypothetical protein